MKECFWTVALLSLLSLSVICEDSSNIQCNGKLGFCSTELYACLKSQIKNDEMNPCLGLTYPDMYQDRVTDAPFAVSSSYPGNVDLKYGLVSINETSGSWNPVTKCCNLTLNEPCEFRPTLPGESFTLFATNGYEFCKNYIFEYPTYELKWCFVEKQPPCLFFDNGGVLIRPEFEDASTARFRIIGAHYCFFEVVAEVVQGNVIKDGLIWDVPGIKMIEGNENGSKQTNEMKNLNKVKTEMGVVPCDMKMNVDNYLQHLINYKIKPHNVICFFSQVEGGVWSPWPCCKERDLTPNNVLGESWKIILVVLCVLIFILFVLLILRHKVKKYIPSYHDTEKDIPKHMHRIEENEEFLITPQDSLDEVAKEVPDEIFIPGLIAKNDEAGLDDEAFVLQNKKNVNNNEESQLKHHLDSGNVVEATCKCHHHFSYCTKEGVPCESQNISKPETEMQSVGNSLESSHDSAIA